MLFYKYLYETDESKQRKEKNEDTNIRSFAPIGVDGVNYLSIQASSFNDCKPQRTINSIEEYTHLEVALTQSKDFKRVKDICEDFPALAEIELYFSEDIYSFVPIDLVDELFQYLVLKKDERVYV